MTTLSFTPNLLRHVETPTVQLVGATGRQVLDIASGGKRLALGKHYGIALGDRGPGRLLAGDQQAAAAGVVCAIRKLSPAVALQRGLLKAACLP